MIPRWAEVRAALLAGVLAAAGVAAIPSPAHLSWTVLKDPLAAEELDRWVVILRRLGLDVDQRWVGDLAIGFSQRARAARKRAVAPFQPFARVTQTGQGWGLFAYPDTHPFRLEIAMRRAKGGWEDLYRGGDAERAFLAPQLHYRRLRGVWSPIRRRPSAWGRFADWTAEQVFAAHDDAVLARVRVVRTHTVLPHEPPDPTEQPLFTEVRRRR